MLRFEIQDGLEKPIRCKLLQLGMLREVENCPFPKCENGCYQVQNLLTHMEMDAKYNTKYWIYALLYGCYLLKRFQNVFQVRR